MLVIIVTIIIIINITSYLIKRSILQHRMHNIGTNK